MFVSRPCFSFYVCILQAFQDLKAFLVVFANVGALRLTFSFDVCHVKFFTILIVVFRYLITDTESLVGYYML